MTRKLAHIYFSNHIELNGGGEGGCKRSPLNYIIDKYSETICWQYVGTVCVVGVLIVSSKLQLHLDIFIAICTSCRWLLMKYRLCHNAFIRKIIKIAMVVCSREERVNFFNSISEKTTTPSAWDLEHKEGDR